MHFPARSIVGPSWMSRLQNWKHFPEGDAWRCFTVVGFIFPGSRFCLTDNIREHISWAQLIPQIKWTRPYHHCMQYLHWYASLAIFNMHPVPMCISGAEDSSFTVVWPNLVFYSLIFTLWKFKHIPNKNRKMMLVIEVNLIISCSFYNNLLSLMEIQNISQTELHCRSTRLDAFLKVKSFLLL